MSAHSRFAEIVEQVRQYPNQWLSDAQALALIALVRDARSLLADMRPYTDTMVCYASTVTEHPPNGWNARIDAFLIATEEP